MSDFSNRSLASTRVIAQVAFCFFFNDTAATEIYTLSLHDALPIFDLNAAGIAQSLLDIAQNNADIATLSAKVSKIGRAHV